MGCRRTDGNRRAGDDAIELGQRLGLGGDAGGSQDEQDGQPHVSERRRLGNKAERNTEERRKLADSPTLNLIDAGTKCT